MTEVESLSLLPADLVPVFCHRDPLLLGLVIRLWQHSRKDKQPLHQLHQEPWPHTEHLFLFSSLCVSFCPPDSPVPANYAHVLNNPSRKGAIK